MADKKSNGRTDKKTIIEEGTEFKGSLSASCPILARGRIEGDIAGPALDVTDTGVVSGQVKVTELRSRGELAGRFDADEVMLSGRVRDDTVIVAKALEVTPTRAGAVAVELDDCELQIGELPSKEQAIRDAMAAGQPS
ncbi:MAG TPA: polymer-forming cytoskeletal protein [Actinomycetota bacterium]|nr:polymer-forming cytoskeletal protein [Actinomycetota bacterium]